MTRGGNLAIESNIATLKLRAASDRLYGLFQDVQSEWLRIRKEHHSYQSLLLDYVFPIALLAHIAGFIGLLMRGVPVLSAFLHSLFYFAFSFLSVFIAAKVIAQLLPRFQSKVREIDAAKCFTFSMYPFLAAGFLHLFPWPLIGILEVLVALYSFHVYWRGAELQLGIPAERRVGFFFVSLLGTGIALGIAFYVVTLPLPRIVLG